MDFFERQDKARRNTKWLVLYFIVCVALTILCVYLVIAFTLGLQRHSSSSVAGLWNPEVFLWATLGTVGIISFGSLYKMSQLSGGGSAVATALGGTPVSPQPTDLDERKLRNVVEEMAIASGVPVPEIYVLEDEPGINAFAAGSSTSDAAIGVTRGAIRLLTRDELQGVIAHEFSHILNGDMRLNLRLMGWVFGILCLTVVGRILLRSGSSRRSSSSSNNKKGGNPLPLIGLALIAIGWIGVFFGKLIKAAVSRQREYLADSAAVQFTRNPSGLAGALKKIGGLTYGSRLDAANAEEASHMFFGNGLGESWMQAFATHPPLRERIQLLEPNFDGKFTKVIASSAQVPPQIPAYGRQSAPPVIPPPIPFDARRVGAESFDRSPSIAASSALSDIGHPTSAHLAYSAGLVHAIPDPLRNAAGEPFSATALIYSLLLSSNADVRSRQLSQLQGVSAQSAQHEMTRFEESLRSLDSRLKLPLVELSIPALRQLSPAQYVEFSQNINHLVEADREVDLFEYALRKTLLRHLDPHFKQVPRRIVQYYSLAGLRDELSLLLSGLAHAGHADFSEIEKAFNTGASILKLKDGLQLLDLNECTMERIDAALDQLSQTAPHCKKMLLQACAEAVGADGAIHVQEAELLRAIADSLDCPMPPFLKL
jgi:Zn-dependent protease with chaperone function/uncharacterized tellurite resistance protein B-like protein